jgi:hypothetical protein
MLAIRDNLAECFSASGAQAPRLLDHVSSRWESLNFITVMTIVQGANICGNRRSPTQHQRLQVARTPFAVTDFNIIIKAPSTEN